jgi:hypothetical protein
MTFRGRVLNIASMVVVLLGAHSLPARAGLQNENLLTPLPQGFKLGWQNPVGQMQEFVRPPDTVEDWSRMITVQIYRALKNTNPDSFADRLATSWTSSCADGSAQRVKEGNENGYPIVVWLYVCPLNPATHKPETMWLKAISGADNLYVTQYAAREEPTKETITPAMEFLRKVVVCDTRRADRQCPAGFR